MKTTFKTECPACQQSIEAPEELRTEGLRCPNCNTGFMPTAIAPAPVVPPSYGTMGMHLKHLRQHTAYPELRELVQLVNGLGLVILILWAAVELMGGLSARYDTSRDETGTASIFLALGLFLLGGFWYKLFRPIASLVIDMADACVDLSRRQ